MTLRAGLLICAGLAWAAPASAQSAQTLAGMRAYNSGDFATAWRLLREAADRGDAEAQANLGYMYARGQGVATDQHAAFHLYALSAEQGDSEGMNALGYKYQFGTGIAKDIGRAIDWYCRAVEYGNPRAMNNLAIMLDAGRELPRDEAEARSLWQQSAALGHNNAMYNLARSYLSGPQAERDTRQGTMWLLRAAQNGQPAAQDVLRRNGYAGALPPPFNQAAMMLPSPRQAAGHTKVCGRRCHDPFGFGASWPTARPSRAATAAQYLLAFRTTASCRAALKNMRPAIGM